MPPPATRVERDLIFTRTPERALGLDLHLPASGSPPFPLVIYIHGGGWREGDKAEVTNYFGWLPAHGYAVASIEYRLSHERTFPAQLEDCQAAVRWLRANGARHGLAVEKIAVIGVSAGGHLAALLGTTGGQADFDRAGPHPEVSSRVTAVVDFFGPADLVTLGRAKTRVNHAAKDSWVSGLLGGPVLENEEKARRASPVHQIGTDAAAFLCLHGTADDLIPFEQSAVLVEKLRAAGAAAELIRVEGGRHRVVPDMLTPGNRERVLAFLAAQLRRD
ncbi:MAG: alpha/beta hydrolase [Verrucomicrobia bacterium]|nr:alpha/beta hydrolase [Verrucomicrobiota bacterium]